MGCAKCRPQQAGQLRMPCGEEHRIVRLRRREPHARFDEGWLKQPHLLFYSTRVRETDLKNAGCAPLRGCIMQNTTSDFLEILRALSEHKVDFIVVGGVCTVLHGAPRFFLYNSIHSPTELPRVSFADSAYFPMYCRCGRFPERPWRAGSRRDLRKWPKYMSRWPDCCSVMDYHRPPAE